jgi:ParB/RepB/Spo0J family partition protein
MKKTFLSKVIEEDRKKDVSILQNKNEILENKVRELEEKLKNNKHQEVSLVSLNLIKLSKNIRQSDFGYKYEDIKSLAEDIENNGQLQPVLITKDLYLIAGFRRFEAMKYLNFKDILAVSYDKKFSEIGKTELNDIQFAENEQRRGIDNFQLSKLYNELLNSGYDSKKIQEKFKKSKSFVSRVITINNIDIEIVKFLKEFQVFGWSEKKFQEINLAEAPEKIIKEFEKIKGNIGISTLYEMAKHESLKEQKKVFLKKFSDRITHGEKISEFFKDAIEKKEEIPQSEKLTKTLKNFQKKVKELIETSSEFPEEKLQVINKNLFEIEEIIKNI